MVDRMPKRLVFLHPDLGIGGAERLIVDMGLALRNKGHDVSIYTSHHDPGHCFPETRDGTLHVVSMFDWLPRSILGRCFAACAFLRMVLLAMYVRLCVPADLYIVDQVSLCVPILQCRGTKVLFYCHFPDLLLTQRTTFLKKLYRAPLDVLEAWTTACADKVFVNSAFTESVVRQTFPGVGKCEILYPSLNTRKFSEKKEDVKPELEQLLSENKYVFFSLNRYERKKNISLALESFSILCKQYPSCHLVVAGGYDPRVSENVQYHLELEKLAGDLHITDHVTFLRSVDSATKLCLLKRSTALIYTPSNEHFGIVPVESMYCGTPVVAVNSGGPLETVLDGCTGFLREPVNSQFAEAMRRFVEDEGLTQRLGNNGRRRVEECFSFQAFSDSLNSAVLELCLIG